jgi:hypothetical protein
MSAPEMPGRSGWSVTAAQHQDLLSERDRLAEKYEVAVDEIVALRAERDALAARVERLEAWKATVNPLKDQMREDMHRRAQAAEGRLEAVRFWIDCIEKWGLENHNLRGVGYLRSVARYAKHEANKPRAALSTDAQGHQEG